MIYVTFGSQTGNSEEIAKRIYKEIKENLKLPTESIELSVMNKFLTKIQKIPENKSIPHIIIGVCSTTGAGDAPTNSDNFVRWIKRKTLAPDTLSNVHYTVLGLGDSNYTKYQFIPKQIDDCLGKLGANKFYQRGEADDAYGLEIVVEPWIDGLYPALDKLLNKIKAEAYSKETSDKVSKSEEEKEKEKEKIIDVNISTGLKNTQEKFERINLHSANKIQNIEKNTAEIGNKSTAEQNNYHFTNESDKNISANNYNNIVITEKKLISGPKSDKRVFSLKFKQNKLERDIDLTNYLPGASIAILPPEDEERLKIINSVIKYSDEYLLIDKSHHFNVYSDFLEKYPHFKKFLQKGYLTRNEIFTYVIDFNSVLKKLPSETLKNLIKEKITNKEVIEKLDLLFSKYTDLILKNKISLYDVIKSLSLYKLTLSLSLLEMLENFPIKYPRNYSLVSIHGDSPNKNSENILEIIFSVVDERIIRKFPNIKFNNLINGIKPGEFYYKGQTTNYLKNLNSGSQMLVCNVKNDGFTFPTCSFTNEETPIIYICNGTGISPCISFLKQLLSINCKNPQQTKLFGELLILTGFRNATAERNETIYEEFIYDAIETLKKSANNKEIIQYKRCVSSSEENEEEEAGVWRSYRININYVQDLIIEYEEKIYDLLFVKNGYLMICGDIQKLYDECIENIISVFRKRSGYSREACVKLIEDMKINNKIIVEKWI